MYKIQKWLHDKLGWGFRERAEGFSFKKVGTFQSYYLCKFCGGTLAQDSQLNWFHLIEIK